jgi:hypothetical protein
MAEELICEDLALSEMGTQQEGSVRYENPSRL